MVKIANLTEFQKNWSLPVVVPGFCLVSCYVPPLGQGQLLRKGVSLWHHFLRRTNVFFDDGSKDTREVLIIQLSFSHLQYHIAQTILSKKKK